MRIVVYFLNKFHWNASPTIQLQKTIINLGSDNGLAPVGIQAII